MSLCDASILGCILEKQPFDLRGEIFKGHWSINAFLRIGFLRIGGNKPVLAITGKIELKMSVSRTSFGHFGGRLNLTCLGSEA